FVLRTVAPNKVQGRLITARNRCQRSFARVTPVNLRFSLASGRPATLRARTEVVMADNTIARRNFLLGAGTAVAEGLAEPAAAQTQALPPANEPQPTLVLSATEAAFMTAAADSMCP